MKTEAKITQLYKSPSEFVMATCQLHGNEDDDRFECKIKGDNQYKAQLWQWVKGNWKDGIDCEVEFSDIDSEGMPKDAIIVYIPSFTPILIQPK